LQIHVSRQGDDRNDGSVDHPMATLPAAQRRVRELIAKGHVAPIEVLIGGGVWRLSKPLAFDHQDTSPNAMVTYRSTPGEKAVFSGGLELNDWQREGEFWTTTLPEATEPIGKPRLLIVNGKEAPLAKEPDEGFYRVAKSGPDRRTSFEYNPEGFVQPAEQTSVELVFLHDWSITRVGLQQIDSLSQQLAFQYSIGGDHEFFAIDGFEPQARYRLENDRAFADTEGEWYFDSRTKKLLIRAAASATTAPRVVLPLQATLVRVQGTAEQPVRNLAFIDLAFEDTRCTLPASGGAEVQAGFFQPRGESSEAEGWLNRLAPAVDFAFSENCVVKNCRFRNLGGGGIYVHEQSDGNKIEGCEFRGLGGCAVMLGDPSPARSVDGTRLVCRDNQLRESKISECGQILFGSVGVWVGITSGSVVERNEIATLPYTGVSLGWQWNPEPTGCEKNFIADNHIHHVMQLLSDGGGIYTLGQQPGSVLRGNRIHDVPLNAGRAESNGIFMDEGSSLIEVTGNEIFATARAPIRFHKAQDLKVNGNRLRLAPGLSPFTYNATDPARIITEPNELIQEQVK
jgi:hypothetical protein